MPSVRQLLGLVAAAAAVSAAPTPLHRHRQRTTTLPDYALTYAPISYLYSGEKWFPSDIATHLENTIPEVDFEAVAGYETAGSVTLATLADFNSSVALTSADGIGGTSTWQLSAYGEPDSTGYSAAPATIIAVQKNTTWVDVFYFYFYSFNHGGSVLGIEFGDHIGDWEHTMIRFVDGEPYAMYFSQHSSGSAYYWDVVGKNSDGRPLSYIAYGGHANYVKAGTEEYTVALGLITDKTDAGTAWDVAQNYRGYWYDESAGTFSLAGGASTGGNDEASGDEGADWLQFAGLWGDDKHPTSYSGQYCLFGECHYTAGPTGPEAKNLGRTLMCQDEDDCSVYDSVDDLTKQSKRMFEGSEAA